MPMLMVLALLAAGALCADVLQLGVWTATLAFVAACFVAAVKRQAVVVMLIMAGALSITMRRAAEQPLAEEQLVRLEITSLAHALPSRNDFDAQVVALHNGRRWQRHSAQVRLSASPTLGLEVGDNIVARTRIKPYDTTTSYSSYMLRVGRTGTIWLDSTKIMERTADRPSIGVRLRQRAMQHIEALELSPCVEAVTAAIAIGERSALTNDVRRHYVRSGGAHLLAVSGLHVGFLFTLVNILLTPLAALRHGQLMRSVVATTVIWLFATMAGFAPSVVRATIMFTLVQVMMALASRNHSLNTLCFAAALMLLWDGRMIYDAGYLLSVLAVAAIVEWGVPLCRHILRSPRDHRQNTTPRQRIARAVWRWVITTAVVSFVASAVTMPLAAYLFGEVSMWSVVVGGVMVALCAVAVSVALLWVAFPIAILNGIAGWIVEHSVGAMNTLAEWCASSNIMSHQIDISLTTCLLLYLAYALITLALWSLPRKKAEN